jgi:hypothetical protein
MPETYRSGHYARGAGETSVTEPLLPRRRSPDFRRYWIARMVSIGGSLVTYVALPCYASGCSRARSPTGSTVGG